MYLGIFNFIISKRFSFISVNETETHNEKITLITIRNILHSKIKLISEAFIYLIIWLNFSQNLTLQVNCVWMLYPNYILLAKISKKVDLQLKSYVNLLLVGPSCSYFSIARGYCASLFGTHEKYVMKITLRHV